MIKKSTHKISLPYGAKRGLYPSSLQRVSRDKERLGSESGNANTPFLTSVAALSISLLTLASLLIVLNSSPKENFSKLVLNTRELSTGSGLSGGGRLARDLKFELGPLTKDWNQTGPFNIVLNNPQARIKIHSADSNDFFGLLTTANLTEDRTWTLPDASGTICLSSGNCAGLGTGGSSRVLAETDTLETVTRRGPTTSHAITVNNNFFVNGNTLLSGQVEVETTSSNGQVTVKTIENRTGYEGDYGVSMAPGPDGFPRMAYLDDDGNYHLKYARCGDAKCSDRTITDINPGALPQYPEDITVGPDGSVYVPDYNNGDKVVKFDSNGNFVKTFGSAGSGDGQFNYPYGIATDSSGNVYVADSGNYRVEKFDSNGNYLTQWGEYGTGPGQFTYPYGVAVDHAGYVYVVDENNYNVQKFDSNGSFITSWGENGSDPGQFSCAYTIAVDSQNNVYVPDGCNYNVQKFDSDGNYLTQWGESGTDPGQFTYPYGIAVDSADKIYVVDSNNYNVQKFDSNGTYLTQWGEYGSDPGQFDSPYGTAVSSTGKVYVVDNSNNRLQVFDTSGNYLDQWRSLAVSSGGVGIAVASDGLARIASSVYDNTTSSYHLALTRCINSDCTPSHTQVIDSTTNYSSYYGLEITIGSNGYPAVAAVDSDTYMLRYYQCNDSNCTNPTVSEIEDNSNTDGNIGLVIGSDGKARIIYHNSDIDALRLARCTDAACTSPVLTTVDTSPYSYYGNQAVFGSEGNLRIAYIAYDGSDYSLHYAICNDPDCTNPTTSIISGTDEDGYYVGLALDESGLAHITMENNDSPNYPLILVNCNSADCTNNSIIEVDSSDGGIYEPGNTGAPIFLSSDGFANIAYDTDGYFGLRFARVDLNPPPAAPTPPPDTLSVVGNTKLGGKTTTGNLLPLTSSGAGVKLTTIADTESDYDGVVAIGMGTDGLPRIAFGNYGGDGLYFYSCSDADCTDPVGIKIDTDYSDDYLSMARGNDGFFRIIYHSGDIGGLHLVRCTNDSCSTHVTSDLDTSDSDMGNYGTVIKIGPDGYPRVAYYDYSNSQIKYIQCTNPDCAGDIPVVLPDPDGVNSNNIALSMALGSDGKARIVYADDTNEYLKLARCTTNDCSSAVITTVDNTSNLDPGNYGLKILLSSDNTPRIAYTDGDNYYYWFAKCNDDDCTSRTINQLEPFDGQEFGGFGMALATDGTARITYEDSSNYYLGLIICSDSACGEYTTKIFDTSEAYQSSYGMDMVLGSDGLPRMAYTGDGDYFLHFARFTTADGSDTAGTSIGLSSLYFGSAYISQGYLQGLNLEGNSSNSIFTINQLGNGLLGDFQSNGTSVASLDSSGLLTTNSLKISSLNCSSGWSNGGKLTTDGSGNVICGSDIGGTSGSVNVDGNNNIYGGSGAFTSNTTGTDNIALGYYALSSNTSGQHNIANGFFALYSNTTGGQNIGLGYFALRNNTTGSLNTAIGDQALTSNTTGYQNIAIGIVSLAGNTTGHDNIASGYYTLFSNTTGNYNIAQGYQALYSNTTGGNNVSLGNSALYSNTTGYENVALGHDTLKSNTSGFYNIAQGYQSLYYNTTGISNTALGDSALYHNTTGNYNVAIGTNALYNNTISSYNLAQGFQALFSNTTGSYNVAQGYQALYSNTTASFNIAIGHQALYSNTTASLNIAIGHEALYYNTTGGNNTAVGTSALFFNTTGDDNSAFGFDALYSNTTGVRNSALGAGALTANTTGTNNSGFGWYALINNTTGTSNSALGSQALFTNTTGTDNVAIGQSTLYSNITGSQNTAVGNNALLLNTGSGNSAFGYNALTTNSTGANNTALGDGALQSNTGSSNIALGYHAGDAITSGSQNIVIGFDVDAPSATVSNQLVIGNLIFGTGITGTGTTIAGKLGIGTNAPDSRLQVSGGGLCVGSDANCNTDNNTEGIIYSSSTSMTVYDVAENYPTKDSTLSFGEIVTLDPGLGVFVKKSEESYDDKVIGAVSEKPGVLLGGFNGQQFKEERQVAVALSGRIEVKVSNENGPILVGDKITSSSTSGVGMRATEAGRIIGIALEDFDGTEGKILVFINPSWYIKPLTSASGEIPLLSDKISLDKNGKVKINGEVIVTGKITLTGDMTITGTLEAKTVRAKQFEVSGTEGPDATAGSATIKAGTSELVIQTSRVTDKSLIFVTPTKLTDYSLAVIEKRPDQSFKVAAKAAVTEDVTFDWVIINRD